MPEEPVAGPDTSSQTPTDPYVIYQLRKPSQRGTAVIPRFVPNTHAPAFSPANYRFARVWATSDSSAAQSALLHIPRSFEYAGSIGSESSIWSDTSSWVSVSSLRTAPSEIRTPLLHQPPAPSASAFFQNEPDKLLRNSLRPSSARSSAPSSDLESPKRPSFRYPPALSESVSEDAIVDDLLSRPSHPPHNSTRISNPSKNLSASTRLPSESPLKELAIPKTLEESAQDPPSIPRISERHRDPQPRESNASRPSRIENSRPPANRSSFLPALTRKRRSLWQWLFCSDPYAHSSVASARLPPNVVQRTRDEPLSKPVRPSRDSRASKNDRDVTGLSHPKPDPRASVRRRRSPSFEIRRGKPAQAEQSRRSLSWSLVPRAILGLGSTPDKSRNSKERRRKSTATKPSNRPVPSVDVSNSARVSYQKPNPANHQDPAVSKTARQQSGQSDRIRSTSSKGRSRESSKGERVRHDQKIDPSRRPAERHRENGRDVTRETRESKKPSRPAADRPRDPRVPTSAGTRGTAARKTSSSSARTRDASSRMPSSGATVNRVGSDMSSKSHPRSSSHSGVSGRDERKASISGSDKTALTPRQLSNASSNKSSNGGYRTPPMTSHKFSTESRHHTVASAPKAPAANGDGQVGTLALAEGMLNGLFPKDSKDNGADHATAVPNGKRLTPGSRDLRKNRQDYQVSPQVTECAERPRAASPSMQAKLFAFPSSSSEGSAGRDSGKLKTNVWEEPPVFKNGITDNLRVNGIIPTHMGPKGTLGIDSKRRPSRMPEAVARAMEKNRARSKGGPLSYLTKHHETEADTNTGSTGLTSLADESVSTHRTVSISGEDYIYVEDNMPTGRRRLVRENGSMDYRVPMGDDVTPSIFQSSALFDRSRSPISGGGASPRRFHSDWSDPHATDIDVYCQCNCSCVYEEECRRSCELIYGRSPSVSSTKSCGRKGVAGGVKAPSTAVEDAVRKGSSRVDAAATTAASVLSGGAGISVIGNGSGHTGRSGTSGKPQKTMMRANTVDELPDVDSGRRLMATPPRPEAVVDGSRRVESVGAERMNGGKQRPRSSSGHSEERNGSPYVTSNRVSREAGKSSMEARVAAATVAALERRREPVNGTYNGVRGSTGRNSNGATKSKDGRRRTSGTNVDTASGRGTGAMTGYEATNNGNGHAPHENELVRTFSNDGIVRKKDLTNLTRHEARTGGTAVKAGRDERNGQTRGLRRSGRTGARHRAPLFGIF